MLSVVWVAFLVLALVCGAATGQLDAVTAAVSTGAVEAVSLAIQIAGIMAFWSGWMAILQAAGFTEQLARWLKPILRPLFGRFAENTEAMESVSANVAANMLGLSNAATPLGLRAADQLYSLAGRRGAPDAVLTLITLNSASIQIIPSTVAALRTSCGSATPFDILFPVWGASIASVAVVLLSGRALRVVFPDPDAQKASNSIHSLHSIDSVDSAHSIR